MLDSFQNSPLPSPLRQETRLNPRSRPRASATRLTEFDLFNHPCSEGQSLSRGVKGMGNFPRTVRERRGEMSGLAKCPLARSPKIFLRLRGAHLRGGAWCGARVSWGSQPGCWEFRGGELCWGLTLTARRRPGRSGWTPPSGPSLSHHPEAQRPPPPAPRARLSLSHAPCGPLPPLACW